MWRCQGHIYKWCLKRIHYYLPGNFSEEHQIKPPINTSHESKSIDRLMPGEFGRSESRMSSKYSSCQTRRAITEEGGTSAGSAAMDCDCGSLGKSLFFPVKIILTYKIAFLILRRISGHVYSVSITNTRMSFLYFHPQKNSYYSERRSGDAGKYTLAEQADRSNH